MGADAGFGTTDYQPPAFFFVERAADTERSCSPIEIGPHEAADLFQTQAGGQFRVEEVLLIA